MARFIRFAALGVMAAGSAVAQPVRMEAEEMKSGVTELLTGYAVDRYEGDVEGLKDAVHHDVARRTVTDRYWGQPSDQWVRVLNHDMMAFAGESGNPSRRSDPENGQIDVTVFDSARETVSAMVETDSVVELVHAVYFENEWKIADTLVLPKRGEKIDATEEDKAEIKQLITDYVVGFYEVDGEKVQNTCHPSLSKRTLEHSRDGSFDYFSLITYEEIEFLGNTFNTHFNFNPSTSRCAIDIYYTDAGHCAAKVVGASWFDYFHIAKVNEEWKIINIMYEGLPESEWQD
jgi:hypothetical protein